MGDTPAQGASSAPAPGQIPASQLDDLTKRLLSRITTQKTSVQPPVPPSLPKESQPMEGFAKNKSEGAQMFVHNLFSLINNAAAAQKKQQVQHAVGVLQSLNNSWTKAQDLAQGDPKKAEQLFSQMPEVTHVLDPSTGEGKKNLKQLGKLLQFDFMNPEKSHTVWHDALGKVVEAGKHLPFIKAIGGLLSQHKQQQQSQPEKPTSGPDSYAGQEQGASDMARKFAGRAQQDPAQQAEINKILPTLLTQQGQDIREREREVHAEHMQKMKNDFATSIDNIKDPVNKAIARSMLASQEGREEDARKWMEQAHKGAEAKSTKTPSQTMPALIYQSINDPDPEKRAAAKAAVDKNVEIQEKLLTARGAAFGMSRIDQYVNNETGETAILNGFQVQDRTRAGESYTKMGNVQPDILLAMQQVVRTQGPAIAAVESHLGAFDNSKDRALIARLKLANPSLRGMDEGTLSTWIDQNLMSQLSPEGRLLMQDVKSLAEVFGRTRKLSGQTSSEMNTALLLGMLPDDKTPSSVYGKQQLEKVKNYIDGMVQAPLLGGGKFTGTPKKSGGKAATKEDPDPLKIN